VLERLGWKIHRIWSRDWIHDPAAEIKKVHDRLVETPAAPQPDRPGLAPAVAVAEMVTLASEPPTAAPSAYLAETEKPEEVRDLPTYVWPYLITKLPAHTKSLSRATPHDVVDEVVKVVGTEGPIHIDLVFKRIAVAWKGRLTANVKQVLSTATEMALREARIDRRGKFLWPIGLATPIVRAPRAGEDARPIDLIAPEEIAQAALLCVQEARSIGEADLERETARLLGFARRSAKLDAAVKQAIAGLKAAGQLEDNRGLLSAPQKTG
jgi:hypothetical protein